MIDLNKLRKAKGYVLAVVDERTGEYKKVSNDVVQVVRCKDCQAWKEKECNLPEHGWCGTLQMLTHAEDYLCGARDVLEHIDSMSTIDAIPIEWVQNILTEIGDDSPFRPAIEWLLLTYKMEKED